MDLTNPTTFAYILNRITLPEHGAQLAITLILILKGHFFVALPGLWAGYLHYQEHQHGLVHLASTDVYARMRRIKHERWIKFGCYIWCLVFTLFYLMTEGVDDIV